MVFREEVAGVSETRKEGKTGLPAVSRDQCADYEYGGRDDEVVALLTSIVRGDKRAAAAGRMQVLSGLG